MSFTDDDLKRLKVLSDGKSLKDYDWFTFKKADALLARLEAAEKNATHVEGLLSVLDTLDALDWGEEGRPCNWDELANEADADNEVWRKSAGKSDAGTQGEKEKL